MPKTNLGSMSVEQLLQLREDVGKELNRKSTELRSQLARLGGEIAPGRGRGGSTEGQEGSAEISRQGRQHVGWSGCKTPMAGCGD